MVVRYSYDAWGMPTILQDSSDFFLAITNPYLYCSYYFDFETLKYYLQSRYYDPVTGRFINADSVGILEIPTTTNAVNLFNYCRNNPINETDRSGLFLASKLAEIFLSAVFGMIAQLFDDLVIYFLSVLVHGKNNARFEPNPSDYASRALSWALNCVNPFSGKKEILNVILALTPVIVKTVWDLASGKGFDLFSLLRNIFYVLLAVIVAKVLGKNTKNKIAQIKKKTRGKKPDYKAKKLQIKAKYKVLGNNITTCIDVSSVIIETILAVMYM